MWARDMSCKRALLSTIVGLTPSPPTLLSSKLNWSPFSSLPGTFYVRPVLSVHVMSRSSATRGRHSCLFPRDDPPAVPLWTRCAPSRPLRPCAGVFAWFGSCPTPVLPATNMLTPSLGRAPMGWPRSPPIPPCALFPSPVARDPGPFMESGHIQWRPHD